MQWIAAWETVPRKVLEASAASGSCQYTHSDPSAPSNVQKDIYNFSENDRYFISPVPIGGEGSKCHQSAGMPSEIISSFCRSRDHGR